MHLAAYTYRSRLYSLVRTRIRIAIYTRIHYACISKLFLLFSPLVPFLFLSRWLLRNCREKERYIGGLHGTRVSRIKLKGRRDPMERKKERRRQRVSSSCAAAAAAKKQVGERYRPLLPERVTSSHCTTTAAICRSKLVNYFSPAICAVLLTVG